MSEASPQLESEILLKADPRAKERRRRSEFWQICWLVSLSSLLISIYSIFLSQRLAPAASQHDLDQAALQIADELARLSINHNRFGAVGLIESSDSGKKQSSLNRLQASLRITGIAARKMGFDSMSEFLSKDVFQANELSRDLAALQRELAGKDGSEFANGKESFLQKVRRQLSRNGPASRLRSIKLRLGGLKASAKEGSHVPLPAIPEEKDSFYADRGNYKTHVSVPIYDTVTYEFYETGTAAQLHPASDFLSLPENQPASAVLIEAEFEVNERGKQKQIRRMQSCALAGAPLAARQSRLFMLSFPQGYLSSIRCLNDLFAPQCYKNESQGIFLQAQDGDIPGDGYLSKAVQTKMHLPVLAAVNRAFYDFMLSCGPELRPLQLEQLLQKPLAELRFSHKEELDSSLYQTNSALIKDTGACAFALLNQSRNKEAGQKALANSFLVKPKSQLMPSCAFPLFVDEKGELKLPAENAFDLELLTEFLESLHQTNIAGIESLKSAELIISRMDSSIQSSQRKLKSLEEELESVESSRLKSDKAGNKRSKNAETGKVQEHQSLELSSALAKEKARLALYKRTRSRAQIAAKNGSAAAISSYEIAAHMSSFVSAGIKKVQGPWFQGFLLSRKIIFIPHIAPVEQESIFGTFQETEDAEEGEIKGLDSGQDLLVQSKSGTKNWLSKHFKVTAMPESEFRVDGRPITEYWQSKPISNKYNPVFFMFSSQEACRKDKEAVVWASRISPFDNGVLPNQQICYYAPSCLESGSGNKQVNWSLLIRDLLYQEQQTAPATLESLKAHWCLDLGMDEERCPVLAAEIQIRSPLPSLASKLSSVYLKHPGGGPDLPLYPPLPPELL